MNRISSSLLLALGACWSPPDPSLPPGSEGAAAGEPQAVLDERDFVVQTEELESGRSEFMRNGATELAPVKNRLFWLQFNGFSPTLYSYDAVTDTRVTYRFSIGSDRYNYRASANLIVTAKEAGGLVYRAYRTDEPETLVGSLPIASPPGGVRWWAYSVDGDSVYYIVSTRRNRLHRWVPATGVTTALFDLEDAGMEIGELWDFGVENDRAVILESGRAWALDIAAQRATWLRAETETTGVSFDGNGVLLATASGPKYHRFATGETEDLTARIRASSYRVNETFSRAHWYAQDFAHVGRHFAYIGSNGVFRMDLETGELQPILLNPIYAPTTDVRVTYRYPVLLEDGSFFITGLESFSGSVGADGPVYRVQLTL